MDSPVEYMKGDATQAPRTPTEIIMNLDTIIEFRSDLFDAERNQGGCDLDITCDGETVCVDGDNEDGIVHHDADNDTDVWVIEVEGQIFVGCDDVGAMQVDWVTSIR